MRFATRSSCAFAFAFAALACGAASRRAAPALTGAPPAARPVPDAHAARPVPDAHAARPARTLATSVLTLRIEGGSVRTSEPRIAGATAVVEVGAAWDHACVRTAPGEVLCWGNGNRHGENGVDPDPSPIPMPDAPVELAVGEYHACARLHDGTVSCWGSDAHRQLGYAAPETCPVGGGCSRRALRVPGVTGAVALAAGEWHTCALLSDTTVKCWGDNSQGQQLGAPQDVDASSDPVAVGPIPGAARLALSTSSSCVVTRDGAVSCWGATDACGARRVARSPERLACLTAVRDIGFGLRHACALAFDGTVSCWGDNGAGQLGVARRVASADLPVPVPDVRDVVELAVGLHATCVRARRGAVTCWGEGHGPPTEIAAVGRDASASQHR